jgi:type IV secretory pathway VirB10-like protein
MELDNVDVLLGMIIGCIILGIGLSLFFTQSYTGYGAVVMAIGMMTLSLMITARPRVIERVKRENMLQPLKQTPPVHATNPPINIATPQVNEPVPTPAENQIEPPQKNEVQPIEPAQPQTQESQESAPEQKTEPAAVVPSA